MSKHEVKKVKGFFITPNAVVAESGDVDDEAFFEGDDMEKTFENIIRPGEAWVCNECDCIFFDEYEAKEHQQDYEDTK